MAQLGATQWRRGAARRQWRGDNTLARAPKPRHNAQIYSVLSCPFPPTRTERQAAHRHGATFVTCPPAPHHCHPRGHAVASTVGQGACLLPPRECEQAPSLICICAGRKATPARPARDRVRESVAVTCLKPSATPPPRRACTREVHHASVLVCGVVAFPGRQAAGRAAGPDRRGAVPGASRSQSSVRAVGKAKAVPVPPRSRRESAFALCTSSTNRSASRSRRRVADTLPLPANSHRAATPAATRSARFARFPAG